MTAVFRWSQLKSEYVFKAEYGLFFLWLISLFVVPKKFLIAS